MELLRPEVKITPRWTKLKEHKTQREFAESDARFIVVPAGRRCLEEGTLVATPNGPVPIEVLKIGDEVIGYNEFNDLEVTTVSQTWDNGVQEVIPLYDRDMKVFSATSKHEVLTPKGKVKISNFSYFQKIISATEGVVVVRKGNPYSAKTYDITVSNNTNLYVLVNRGIIIKNSGKTELAKRKIIKHALMGSKFFPARYFVAAPVREQVRRIYWEDLKALIPEQVLAHPPVESRLEITLINGSQIHLIGMDKPERIEGSPWDGGILDEFASMKERSWGAHVRPALSDRNGFCWFIGVPEGRGMYYEFFLKGKNGKDRDWKSFTWKSIDILNPDEVRKAQEELDELTFRQEYEGDFVSFSGRAYYSFDANYNVANLEYFSHLPLVVCFDFNVSPGVASFLQEQDKERHYPHGYFAANVKRSFTAVIDEIYFEKDSNTVKVCNEIIKRYGTHKGEIHAYGDATGGSDASAKVLGSDWNLIENMLDGHFGERFKMMVAAKNPLEKNRVTHLNSRIRSFDGTIGLMVDKEFAPKTFRDFVGVTFKGDGSGDIDKKSNIALSHISDAIGYFCFQEHPISNVYNVEYDGY
jgi:hypothetical protein